MKAPVTPTMKHHPSHPKAVTPVHPARILSGAIALALAVSSGRVFGGSDYFDRGGVYTAEDLPQAGNKAPAPVQPVYTEPPQPAAPPPPPAVEAKKSEKALVDEAEKKKKLRKQVDDYLFFKKANGVVKQFEKDIRSLVAEVKKFDAPYADAQFKRSGLRRGTAVAGSDLFTVATGVDPATHLFGMLVSQWDRTVHAFVPLTGSPTQIPVARELAGAAQVGTKIYLFFGTSDRKTPINEVWVNDTSTNAWTKLSAPASGPIPVARAGQVVKPLADGRIFMFGGFTGPHTPADASAWIYDPATNTWTQGEESPVGAGILEGAIDVTVGGTDVIAVVGTPLGGQQLQIAVYDPVGDSWQEMVDEIGAPMGRYAFGLSKQGNKVRVLGGCKLEGSGVERGTAEVWEYDFDEGSWTPAPSLPAAMVLVQEGIDLEPVSGSNPIGHAQVVRGHSVAGDETYVGKTPQEKYTPLAITGADVTGETPGTVYADLSLPGSNVFLGSFKVGPTGKPVAAIFDTDGKIRIEAGDEAPGFAGTKITKFGQPTGHAAAVALKDGRTALLADLDAGGEPLTPLPVRTAALTGDPVAGSTLKSILQVDGNGSHIFFTGKLASSAKDDDALFSAASDGTLRAICREGQWVGGKTVSVIATMVALKDSAADSRWRAKIGGKEALAVRLTFTDKSQAIYAIPFDAADTSTWQFFAQTGDAAPGTGGGTIASLGFPGMGDDRCAFLATATGGDADKSDDQILYVTDTGGVLTPLAREGRGLIDSIGDGVVPDVIFQSFADPVASAAVDGGVFVLATLQGAGAAGKTKTALCRLFEDGSFKLDTRTGYRPGGERGYASITGLSLPNDTGDVAFLGNLAPEAQTGVNGKNDASIAIEGELSGPLLREGSALELTDGTTRTVSAFEALTAAPGSFGAGRGIHHSGIIWALVTFTDKTRAIIPLQTPE